MKQSIARLYTSQSLLYRLYASLVYLFMITAIWGVFIYAPTEKMQGIVQKIFYFHVSSALTMFFAFFVVFIASIACLAKDSSKANTMALYFQESKLILYAFLLMICLVAMLGTLTVLQGNSILASTLIRSLLYLVLGVLLVYIAHGLYVRHDLEWWDSVAMSAAEIGLVFCTLVLITGPIWARPIWGTWWSWDPTLTLTLVLWLIYVAYLMLRAEAQDARRTRLAAVLGIVGFVDVPLIRWSVEKWRTLHPKPVVIQEGGSTGLSPAMMLTFLLCLGAFLLLFFFIMRERIHLARIRQEIDALRYRMNEFSSP